jgi:hypothetical protein
MSHDKQQGDLVDQGRPDLPEGLRRERKGPIDKDSGLKSPGQKAQEEAANQETPTPGQPAGGE